MSSAHLRAIAQELQRLRERSGIAAELLEERMILGPGWIERIESGEVAPTIDMLLALLHQLGFSLRDLATAIPEDLEPAEVERTIYALEAEDGLDVHFRYTEYDAVYHLSGCTLEEFEAVLKTLRNGLAKVKGGTANLTAMKADAVADAFLVAVHAWPHINPSDIWWFIIHRAYLDPFNHPAEYSRLSFEQSWKRTAGWALEKILVKHYEPFLREHGIGLEIGTAEEKEHHLRQLDVKRRLEADKIDVLLLGLSDDETRCFGVVHVKASFAERRTDDVPMSAALVEAGYTSPLWTMDCKSTPGERPVNRGELGAAGVDARRRSAKRKDIEDDAYFSACFSYNSNTEPTPAEFDAQACVYVCDFTDPEDAFSRFVIEAWEAFRSR